MALLHVLFLLFLILILPPSKASSTVNFTSLVDAFQTTSADCTTKAKCQPMVNTTCLGTTVRHAYTSHVLANDSMRMADIHDKLTMWQGLQYVPKCWEVVQPFLCAIYMPKCEEGSVEIPSYDMCSVMRRPCKIVEIENGWPEFLKCDGSDGEKRFPETCPTENAYKQVRFNTTGECEPPLVATDNEKSWYDNVEGCGIQCYNPLYTEEEHSKIHVFIGVFASLCLVSTFFTLMTFFADWKNSSKYPAMILFYMNACFFMGSIGFLAQFPNGAREDIICRHDGTMRLGEPSEEENLSCVIVFVIVYYFIIAGCIWFVNLAYAWHISFRAMGRPNDALRGITAYFHLIAWSVPLVLVVVVLASNQVDGDSVSGICFVGYQDHYYRAGFVLLPLGAMLVVGGGFLISGVATLCNLERDNPGLLNDKASSRIKGTIVRIGVFAFLAFLFVFITFACHVYEFTHQASWEKGFQDYLVCEANVTILSGVTNSDPLPACALTSRPNLSVVLIHLFSMFGAGIAMSMWVWTPSTVAIWKRFWRKITRQPINEPLKLKKSRMIAKAFAKKNGHSSGMDDFHERLSVSFEEVSHDDAIGMKFDLPPKSSASVDSSTDVFGENGVPTKLLSRRGAALPVVKSKAKHSNSVQADVVIEPPPRQRQKHKNRNRKKSKHKSKGSSVENSNLKRPMNMAFIEEENDQAMADYHQGDEDGAEIVEFLQGYRKSRENTPEEHQFVSASPGQQEATPMLPPNKFDVKAQMELEEAEYNSNYAPGFHQVYHQQRGSDASLEDCPTPLEDYDSSPANDCGDAGFVQVHGEDIKNAHCGGGEFTNTQGVFHNDYPEQSPLNGCHPGQNTPNDSKSHPGQNTPSSYYGKNTPDSLRSRLSPDYSDSCRSSLYGTDDDVELPPHLCGSVTPDKVHEFVPAHQPVQVPVPVPSLFYYLPGALRPAIPAGPVPRGRRPMGHNMIPNGRQLPNQNYIFDSVM